MAASDNQRVLKDEKTLLETEAAFAREEVALVQRLESVLAVSYETSGVQLIARIDALERAGVASPDLGTAKAVISAGIAPDPLLAGGERTASITARQTALKAREAAFHALAAAVMQLEAVKVKRQKEFEAVETFVAGTEAAVRQMLEEQRRAAEAAAAAPSPVPVAVAPRAPVPPLAPVAPPPAVVAAPKAAEAAPPPAKKAAPPPTPTPPAPREKAPPAATTVQSAPVAPAKAAASAPAKPAARKKVSRRRRVRVAPPPKSLEVEVAVYGDNNFYTGFDNRIASGGVFVASVETLPPGHELEVLLDVEGKKFKSRGKVEFVRVENSASPDCTPGAGLKLLGLSGESVSAIEAFFQKRPPLFVVPMQSAA